MVNGIYIIKLEVIGDNKPTASIKLGEGLNVLSGASNTGKSYVFECIDYIFGSKDSPKDIEEAKGYSEVRAEIHTSDGKNFSLSRKFNDSSIYLAKCPLDEFKNAELTRLSSQHSSANDNNLSTYLLNLLGLKGKKLRTNVRNEKRTISFRDLIRFCLINETRIITTTSPIHTGQKIYETVEESLFKLILSGKDDDDLETFDDPKIFKSKILGKIEYINNSKKNKEAQLNEIKKKVETLEMDALNIQIDELTQLVDMANREVLEEEQKRGKIWEELSSLNAKLNQIKELENRFNLLNKHYESDLNRLKFINEGKQFVDQVSDVDCPICGTLIKKKLLEPYEDNNVNIIESLKQEFLKIKKKQVDLTKTMEGLIDDKTELIVQITKHRGEFEQINKYITSKLKPIYEVNSKKLGEYIRLKNEKSEIEIIEKEITELNKEKEYYDEKLKEKQKTGSGRILSEKIYTDLSFEIKKILCDWKLKCGAVYYDKSENDIEIDAKKRKNFGKGYRAIYLAAFVIAVMRYCLLNNRKHPHFIVLDSPLTSYKEKDKTPEEDKLGEEIQNNFYNSLSKLKDIKTCQIFIIDNKDPSTEVQQKINYEHFSGNEDYGRFGFFPIRQKD